MHTNEHGMIPPSHVYISRAPNPRTAAGGADLQTVHSHSDVQQFPWNIVHMLV